MRHVDDGENIGNTRLLGIDVLEHEDEDIELLLLGHISEAIRDVIRDMFFELNFMSITQYQLATMQ